MNFLYELKSGRPISEYKGENYNKKEYAVATATPSSPYKGIKFENGKIVEYDLPLEGDLLRRKTEEDIAELDAALVPYDKMVLQRKREEALVASGKLADYSKSDEVYTQKMVEMEALVDKLRELEGLGG